MFVAIKNCLLEIDFMVTGCILMDFTDIRLLLGLSIKFDT